MLKRRYLKDITDKKQHQYFDNIIKFQSNELFIDRKDYIGVKNDTVEVIV